MAKQKSSDNIKVMVYMPRKLHHRLRLLVAKTDKSNKSAFICELVTRALDHDLHFKEMGE